MYPRSLSKNALCLSLYCKCLKFYIDWSARSEMILLYLSAKSSIVAKRYWVLRPEEIILHSRTHPFLTQQVRNINILGGPEHMDVRRSGFRRDAAHGLRWWWVWWTYSVGLTVSMGKCSLFYPRFCWRMIKVGRLLMRKFTLIRKKAYFTERLLSISVICSPSRPFYHMCSVLPCRA